MVAPLDSSWSQDWSQRAMTIIVYDGETLATDRMISTAGRKSEGDKAWYSEDYTGRCICTGHGNYIGISAICAWYEGRLRGGNGTPLAQVMEKLNQSEGAVFIVVNRDGLRYYSQPWRAKHLGKAKVAFGIGADFAYGAMYMGATAEQAVEAANEYSIYCGNGVATYTL